MKRIISILVAIIILSSCGGSNQDKAVGQAGEVASAIKEMQPGGIPTTGDGWTMRAKIKGKEWVANSIIPPDAAGRIIGEDNGTSIGLPYDRRGMVVGNKTKFSSDKAVDLFLPSEEGGILGGYEGEMEITKADDQWAEGTFHFKGSSSQSTATAEVTNGFFRISMARPQK